ncbi:transglycosylase SLT domain-containing protein [Bradyrhizobium sp.]|uniref:transglycosylase SLT domain-containing protein n=1 Tax=Bradyrhizobium sp. TaxID=376 RepID=UPI0025C090AF|nr:transglycosylase SLT domain-containing protein [Bradyrhizobium sp.]
MSVVPQPPVAARQTAQGQPSPGVAGAIQQASQATGTSFEYLLATAKVESNFNPKIQSRSSSATGLFQFIEQTWLGMMKGAGRALGFGQYSDAISRNASGRFEVADPRLREEILQLRRDSSANAAMAGAFTKRNAEILGPRIGRQPTDGELYMAHFFGAGGAAQLINAARDRPQADAASLFPAAARANRSIFYDRQGGARSVAGVYAELNRRYAVARASVVPGASMIASNAPPSRAVAPAPDTAGTAQAFAVAAAPPPVARAAEPAFRSMFQDAESRGAVSPVVSALWSVPVPSGAAPETASAPPQRDVAPPQRVVSPVNNGEPLDLFRDSRPDVRRLFSGGGLT